MQFPPVEVLQSWPKSNYSNPSEVRGPSVLISTYVFVPLVIILVGLRLYTRLHISKYFGADDVLIVAAALPILTFGILTIPGVLKFGWTRHLYDVQPENYVITLKLTLAMEILFAIGCSLTKISMLLLILRVLGVRKGVA